MIPERFQREPGFDAELVEYKRVWVEAIGKEIRREMRLDDWVRMSTVAEVPLGISYMDMDEFFLEAVRSAVNDYIEQQNKAHDKAVGDMNHKIESMKPKQSAMSGMPMPSFIQK